MKLRIKGNSLRLRLTQSEVIRLAQEHRCIETMTLSDAAFVYQLEASSTVDAPQASFTGHELTVTLPLEQVSAWADSQQVGISTQHGPLAILVEKDFACLQPREGDDDADTFPHPLQNTT